MTSKLVVNTIEADTGISSVSFASSISMSSTSKFHFSNAGIDIGADTNINRPAAGVLGFNFNNTEKFRIGSSGNLLATGITTSNNGFMFGTGGQHYLYQSASDTISLRITSDGPYAHFKDVSGDVQMGSASGTLRLSAGGNEKVRITSSGQLLVNATTINAGGATPKMAIDVGDSNLHGITIQAGGGENNGDLAGLAFSHGNTADIARPKAAIAHNRTASYGVGDLCFYVDGTGDNNAVSTSDEKLRITSSGQVNIGTSGVLKAVINSSISGHQFISQVDDNNTGFEVYSQHGSTATRSSFTVYANTGSGGAKRTQFVVAGDDRAYFRGDVQPESDGDINFGTDARTWNKMYYRNAYPDQGTEISISGSSFLSSTFYDVGYSTGNMGGIDLNGTYIITCYSDNHQAGGGNYGITYTWIVGIRNQSTNQNTTNEVPLLSVTGHSTNNQLIELRTKRENAVDGGDEFLVWRPQSNLGTIDGSSGKTMKWRVQRIGRSSLG